LRFPGQYYDRKARLPNNWHRYYDPATGRYQRTDPIGLTGGKNFFSYAQANPINLFNPKGLTGKGAGAYFGGGAETSYSSSNCCKKNLKNYFR
jgi:RHS repeat-associated protein